MNCKCCRYLIRAGKIDKAETMAAQFTRENTTVQENLKEMQVLWFQIECAQTYFRQGKNPFLKLFYIIFENLIPPPECLSRKRGVISFAKA